MDDAVGAESSSSENQTQNKQKRRNYTLSFKSEVVEYALEFNNCQASKKYGVPRQCIQRWISMQGSINELVKDGKDAKRRRVEGGGRRLNDSQLDESLAKYVQQKRHENHRVTRADIQRHARLIAEDKTFKASNGWLQRFMVRHGFSLRRATTKCQNSPEQYQEKIIDFLLYVEKLKQHKNYDYVYACDETTIDLDFTNSVTLASEGTHQVSGKSTDTMHITVMLTARHDGTKCRPFVLLPEKRPVEAIITKFRGKLNLAWCGNTFFNNTTTEQYLETTMGSTLFENRLLVWDSFRSHISESTKNVLQKLNIDTAVIPGAITKFIQASDVYWKSVFKSKIRSFYEEWMMNDVKSCTRAGNMCAVPMEVYLQWIVDSWDSLPEDLIRTSFIGCGINNDVNVEDDEKIDCFKNRKEFTTGIEQLRERRIQRLMDTLDDFLKNIDLQNFQWEDNAPEVESDDSLEFEV